ncbi:hypothetical protein PPERSA_09938 [Pseudocohnilembus persalinus]|uniref:Nucleolar protein 12 n=1 Tax=Pseudocohnilembus persalinus TaxID=266149 RepID=A0A0V0QJ87_PSEPJ|nr:hypothetical protein PPERSA_09938 [Pseudocohnilembus persalinus]|eukprot:KRX02321.1 hypothetical protein PPERSA_09938 [Pseudocohnilembus persalinus]
MAQKKEVKAKKLKERKEKKFSKGGKRGGKKIVNSTISFNSKKGLKQQRPDNHALAITKKISKKDKIAVVFDEKERENYLGGFYGAKKKRYEGYREKAEKHKQEFISQEKNKIRQLKKEQIKKYNEEIQKTQDFLNKFDRENKKDQVENVKTINNTDVEIKIQYL